MDIVKLLDSVVILLEVNNTYLLITGVYIAPFCFKAFEKGFQKERRGREGKRKKRREKGKGTGKKGRKKGKR